MRFFSTIFLLIISLHFSKDLLGQSSFTLKQCRDYAINNSSITDMSAVVSTISDSQGELLRKLVTPSATGFAIFSYQSDTPNPNSALNAGFDFIPLSKEQYRTGIVVKQNIYLGGEYIIKKELISNENAIANLNLEQQKIILENSSDDLFFSLLLLNESLKILESNKAILEVDLNKLKESFNQGKIFYIEVLKIEAALAELELKVEELMSDGVRLRRLLSVLTGVEVKEEDTFERPTIYELDGYENNLLYRRLMLESQKNSLSQKLSKALAMPKAYLFGVTGFARPALDFFSNNPDVYGVVGLSINIPITGWRDYKKQSKIATLHQRQLNLIHSDLERESMLKRASYQEDVKKYKKLIVKDSLLIDKYKSIREQTQLLLNAGETGSSELVKVLSQESKVKINMEYHKIELIKASIKSSRVVNEKVSLLE